MFTLRDFLQTRTKPIHGLCPSRSIRDRFTIIKGPKMLKDITILGHMPGAAIIISMLDQDEIQCFVLS